MPVEKPRIRLSGVELEVRDAGLVVVPWRHIGPRPHYATTEFARELFPGLPRRIPLSGLPRVRRAVRALQIRAALRRLNDPNFKEFATCAIRSPAFESALGALLLISHAALVTIIVCKFHAELPEIIRTSTIALVAIVAILVIGIALLMGGFVLLAVAFRTWKRVPASLAVRMSHKGASAIRADGTEKFIPWRELIASRDNRDNLFAPSGDRPVCIACGSILLEAARVREAQRALKSANSAPETMAKSPVSRALMIGLLALVAAFSFAMGLAQYDGPDSIHVALRVALMPPFTVCLIFATLFLIQRLEGADLRRTKRPKRRR